MQENFRIKVVTASHSKQVDGIGIDEQTSYEDLLRPYWDDFDGQPVLACRNNQLHELAEKVLQPAAKKGNGLKKTNNSEKDGAPAQASNLEKGEASAEAGNLEKGESGNSEKGEAPAEAGNLEKADAPEKAGDEGKDDNDQVLIFYDTSNPDGYRVYMRSLSFVFICAVYEVEPAWQVYVEHSISGALYCTLHKGNKMIGIDTDIRNRIMAKMREIVEKDLPIRRRQMPVEAAIRLFSKKGRQDKVDLLKYRQGDETAVYTLDGYDDSFYGYMVPSTRYVDTFNLEIFDRGLVVVGPKRDQRGIVANFAPQYKLSDSYNEAESWSALQEIHTAADLNAMIRDGRIGAVVRMTEALQQHKVMEIAEEIRNRNKRIILIAAPSSSGKTSFCHQLITTLRVLGLRPVPISMDDYFVNREDSPRDAKGEYDFESIQALDLKQFNEDMNKLLRGEPVEKIHYDFISGHRVYDGEEIRMEGFGPLVIEGIHGLNPVVTRNIVDEWKYRVYLSVTTQINLDDHNRIPTTDLRLMRRMARGMKYRGTSARQTIAEWPKVRAGEERNIFPYSEEADILFNSAFVYEIAALKPIVEKALQDIRPSEPEHIEANRILSMLRYIAPMEDTSDIVNTSILREFIGGSKLV